MRSFVIHCIACTLQLLRFFCVAIIFVQLVIYS